MLERGSHRLTIVKDGDLFRASCSCGWEDSTRSRSTRGATQGWQAHAYAKGARTTNELRRAMGS